MTKPTTHNFQAAVSQVMSLVINSLYSNKEIFLRELLSNASDALDKLRFRRVTEEGLGDEELRIRVKVDKEEGTLTISDTGVGMTYDELVENLGTVAHSGSKAFLEKLAEQKDGSKDVDLIGQFGVGFYSSYLVADRVEVVSRAAGTGDAHLWSSDAKDTFTVEPAERSSNGTDIVIHLKDDQKEFLSTTKLRSLVERYSDYVEYPIEIWFDGDDKALPREDGQKGEGESSLGKWEKVNRAHALWQRNPSEVSEEQYSEFYRHLTHDWETPLAHKHFRIEGTQLFSGLLFLPARAPFDLFSPETEHGVRLHVKRVFIMDDCDELLPRWLRFIRGVVDSEDLPLNVSRELLQDSTVVKVIRKQVVKQALDMIESLDEETYAKFWGTFGTVVKEGLHFDKDHKDRLAKLVRFHSTYQDEGGSESLVSLVDYRGRMKESQKAIYYMFGATRKTVENAPHLEKLREAGVEVLLMTDAVDQWAVDGLAEFDGVPLVSVMSADLMLEDDGAESKEDVDSLAKRFRQVLQDHVSEVRPSTRLSGSPVCLVLPEHGLPPYLERLMRVQNPDMPVQKRALEINPDHPLIHNLRRLDEASGDEPSADLTSWIEMLYDQALIAEGSPIVDPSRLAKRMTELLTNATAVG